MKGKNSKNRYILFKFENEEWIKKKKYPNMSDIAEEINLSYPTCMNILKKKHTKYDKIYKIKKILDNRYKCKNCDRSYNDKKYLRNCIRCKDDICNNCAYGIIGKQKKYCRDCI